MSISLLHSKQRCWLLQLWFWQLENSLLQKFTYLSNIRGIQFLELKLRGQNLEKPKREGIDSEPKFRNITNRKCYFCLSNCLDLCSESNMILIELIITKLKFYSILSDSFPPTVKFYLAERKFSKLTETISLEVDYFFSASCEKVIIIT